MTNEVLTMEYTNSLEHHGIQGQKWGVRRFQNPDGTYTSAGKERRAKIRGFRINKYANRDGSLTDAGKQRFKTQENYKKFKEKQHKKRIEAAKRVGIMCAKTALKTAVAIGGKLAANAMQGLIQNTSKIYEDGISGISYFDNVTGGTVRPGQGDILGAFVEALAGRKPKHYYSGW